MNWQMGCSFYRMLTVSNLETGSVSTRFGVRCQNDIRWLTLAVISHNPTCEVIIFTSEGATIPRIIPTTRAIVDKRNIVLGNSSSIDMGFICQPALQINSRVVSSRLVTIAVANPSLVGHRTRLAVKPNVATGIIKAVNTRKVTAGRETYVYYDDVGIR